MLRDRQIRNRDVYSYRRENSKSNNGIVFISPESFYRYKMRISFRFNFGQAHVCAVTPE